MVPQSRSRAPNAVAMPAVDPIPPPGGMPRAHAGAEVVPCTRNEAGLVDFLRDEQRGSCNR